MKKYAIIFAAFVVFSVAYSNCSQSGFQTSVAPPAQNVSITPGLGNTGATPNIPLGTDTGNTMKISVGCGYINEPCVSVTICVPGTTQCQTISNLLLDTGSTGLRIFSGAVNISLPDVNNVTGNSLGTCVTYGDGTYQWGSVKSADVYLAQDVAANIPIQVIDFSYGDKSSSCKSLAGVGGRQDAMANGYNGILGVQFFKQDCGDYCATNSLNQIYYACVGSVCSSEAVPLAKQVANPVSALNKDNNGIIIKLPALPLAGLPNVTGSVVLGIGTQPNNIPGSPRMYAADPAQGFIYTTYKNKTYEAIIDSGSMGYYFPDSSIATCPNAAGWYCPSPSQAPNSVVMLSATMMDYKKQNSQNLGFYVAVASQLYQPNTAFNDLSGPMPANIPAGSTGFIWGFPFFTGRSVYIGIEGATSALGPGPYWAF